MSFDEWKEDFDLTFRRMSEHNLFPKNERRKKMEEETGAKPCESDPEVQCTCEPKKRGWPKGKKRGPRKPKAEEPANNG